MSWRLRLVIGVALAWVCLVAVVPGVAEAQDPPRVDLYVVAGQSNGYLMTAQRLDDAFAELLGPDTDDYKVEVFLHSPSGAPR